MWLNCRFSKFKIKSDEMKLQVRALTNMCSVPLDLFSMLELGGQQPSSAMVSMNQLTTGQHLANR